MGRDNSSDRSRSRGKKYRKSNSQSQQSGRRKHFKYQKNSRDENNKFQYNHGTKSDIKNHIKYENIKIRHKSDQQQIMQEVHKILKRQFGPIQHVTKTNGDDKYFSFAVGFKYDKDALRFVRDGGSIDGIVDKIKLVGKPTLVFQHCIPLLKQAIRQNPRPKSPQIRKHTRKSSSDRQDVRQYNSRRPYSSRSMQKDNLKSIWMFGLPWSIKGKQVVNFLTQHSSGPFSVNNWKWIRVKNSNCQFMQVTLDQKKANKLLGSRQQQQIDGSPCIITSSVSGQSQDIIKEILKQYQFKITFPQKINPGCLYKALNDSARVVQIISVNKLVDGCSDSFIVTLSSSSKAKDVKRLNYLSSTGIRVQEIKGQLVFRPTKQSKMIQNDD